MGQDSGEGDRLAWSGGARSIQRPAVRLPREEYAAVKAVRACGASVADGWRRTCASARLPLVGAAEVEARPHTTSSATADLMGIIESAPITQEGVQEARRAGFQDFCLELQHGARGAGLGGLGGRSVSCLGVSAASTAARGWWCTRYPLSLPEMNSKINIIF
eukprot:SAG31_NODE_18605_length_630_cov_0.676083_1_plen_162_part_00